MNKALFFLTSAFVAASLYAAEPPKYTDCSVVVTNGAPKLEPLPRNRVFAAVLDRCSFKRDPMSTPESFIVSGRVVSNNTGGPVEGVAISIRARGGEPHLVGMSNADGEFRFRVWIQRSAQPQFEPEAIYNIMSLPSLGEGDLCIGGAFGTNRVLASGTVARYDVADLASSGNKESTR